MQMQRKQRRRLQGFDDLKKVFERIQFKDGIEVIPEIRIAT